ncbi:SAM-dependent methyltransferase [Pandoraea captiosa]|jgi:ubiquinone/menaquinone biosynthesis C-methylase UbiE|uniref:SAM-dependent methyltransferase n=1 Tax=Pandoraea captiosa TaxID=2508302 RepID=A0A5E5AI77_9BURK|nr:methyltransferase domain-containing protein [Pandoraea captiosa]VVE71800.1 SAM-dependent methyltransferase [Pandoraea captiosa]
MSDHDKVFDGSIPKCYDTLMVPLIFEAYADDTARLVAASSPDAVLETAAGSGALTRALAPRLVSHARYVVTDLNVPMLDYAASRQPEDVRIEWREADALALPFDAGSFDVVVCQFGAMFFPDRTQGFAQALRVLKPGGRFIFSVWDRIEANEFANEVTHAVTTLFPDDPPRFLARTPHGYHDPARIREDLQRAGFTQIDIETRAGTSVAASARDAAIAYCHGTPLRNALEARGPDALSLATDAATKAISARHGDGQVSGKIQAHIIVATQ